MTTDALNLDPAAPSAPEEKTTSDDAGTSGGTDWELEAKAYKKRFATEQSRSSRLETERDEARSDLSNQDRMVKRLTDIEETLADIGDRTDSQTRQPSADPFDDDLDDNPPAATTGTRRQALQESRQAESKRETDATANQVYNAMTAEWSEGMDNASPEMVEITRLYNSALEDPAMRGNLNSALVMFRSYKRSVESAAPPAPPPPTPSGEGDGTKGEGSADSDNPATDEPSTQDDTPTLRQQNRDKGVDQGQEGSGGAVPRDQSKLSATDKFKLHHEGATPDNY